MTRNRCLGVEQISSKKCDGAAKLILQVQTEKSNPARDAGVYFLWCGYAWHDTGVEGAEGFRRGEELYVRFWKSPLEQLLYEDMITSKIAFVVFLCWQVQDLDAGCDRNGFVLTDSFLSCLDGLG